MADDIRVLYVDDEPELLDLGRIYLEQSGGFAVSTSLSAADSLASRSLMSYDAIIADYQMPGMDGIAFLKNVRQQCGNIPFILFTGRGREDIVIQAINNGADFYLQKGGEPNAQFAELAHKVRQAVARRKSESEIVSIFKAVPVGIGLVTDRVLVRVNDRLCTMTGYSREELEGKNTRFLYLNDEDYAAVGRMRDQAYQAGAPEEIEIPWRRRDGSVIEVHITAAAIDPTNPLASMTYSALDITRAKKDHTELRAAYEQLTVAEEELRQQYDELALGEKALRAQYDAVARSEERLKISEAELAGILRAAPVGIGLISRDRVLLRVNRRFCEITGYSGEELVGHNTRFLYPDDNEYAKATPFYSHSAGEGESIGMVETRFSQKDGAIKDIRLFVTMIDQPGSPVGYAFVVMNITDGNRAG